MLNEIKKPNREHARRLLQCLVVAIRPLRVEELAEVLAVDFDDDEGIPKLNPDWRLEDEEQALLTSCSSLIAIVKTDDFPIVQFSHFSVKEFLTSTRLADSRNDVARFHVDIEAAHTVLGQACMGVLLRPDDLEDDSIWRTFSRAGYAAQFWVKHAQFQNMPSSLKKPVEYLFDSDKPHFASWLQLRNIGAIPDLIMDSSLSSLDASPPSDGCPLYYAALYGFQDLVERLVIQHPQDVKANGGRYGTPLVAALAGRHFQIAKFLHDNGAHLDVRYKWSSPLHSAVDYGDVEMVQVLLGYEADVNDLMDGSWTLLHGAASGNSRLPNIVQSSPDVARILLEHGADVNARSDDNSTPLHIAACAGWGRFARALGEHRANVELIRILLECGADVNARTIYSETPLLMAALYGKVEVVQMLIKYGANTDVEDQDGRSVLHMATRSGNVELVRMLLEYNGDVNVRTKDGSTPLLMATKNGNVEVVQMLIKHGANADVEDEGGRTLLHWATISGNVELVRMLLEHNPDANARAKDGSTLLLMAAENGNVEVVQMLTKCGANKIGRAHV